MFVGSDLPAGAVLAGGRSRRMGTDKASLVVDGVPLGRRAVDALLGNGLEPVVVVGGPSGFGVDLVGDLHPGSGPLGGVVTALDHLRSDVIVLPCDLPAVRVDDVRRLLESAGRSIASGDDVDVHLVTVGGGPRFPCGWWRISALPPALAAFDEGLRSLRAVVDRLRVAHLELGRGFEDADSPEELSGAVAWDSTTGDAGGRST